MLSGSSLPQVLWSFIRPLFSFSFYRQVGGGINQWLTGTAEKAKETIAGALGLATPDTTTMPGQEKETTSSTTTTTSSGAGGRSSLHDVRKQMDASTKAAKESALAAAGKVCMYVCMYVCVY
jgi:hypothetical protein